MTAEEQRTILEEIARNEDNYPRDRIAAVRALRELGDDESTMWVTRSIASSPRRRGQADFCFHAKAEAIG
jgi:hypothetical protein